MPAATRHPNLRLDQQLCFALYSATHAMTRAYRSALADLGLTYPQYLVMLALWSRDGQSVSAIAATLDLDPPTLTPMLKRLEQAGWVLRRRRPRDERVVEVTLTPAGLALQDHVAPVQAQMARQTGLDADAFLALKASLQDLSAHLGAERGAETPATPVRPRLEPVPAGAPQGAQPSAHAANR